MIYNNALTIVFVAPQYVFPSHITQKVIKGELEISEVARALSRGDNDGTRAVDTPANVILQCESTDVVIVRKIASALNLGVAVLMESLVDNGNVSFDYATSDLPRLSLEIFDPMRKGQNVSSITEEKIIDDTNRRIQQMDHQWKGATLNQVKGEPALTGDSHSDEASLDVEDLDDE